MTPKQGKIMELVCQGKSNEEIGEALGLAAGTIKGLLLHIYEKLGAKNRAHAVALFLARNDK